jgi:hypothetical protein
MSNIVNSHSLFPHEKLRGCVAAGADESSITVDEGDTVHWTEMLIVRLHDLIRLPNGMVAYGVICFLTVLVFTAFIVWYYARPKLPPMVGVLTFLAWSHDDDTPAAASVGDSNRCRHAG